MNYEPVIGLEVHVQLKTKSKLFSGSSTTFGAEPNTQASEIDLGFPGVLPVLNREVVALAVRFGLSIHAQIAHQSIFARKNYFYPDLPKGYQISQYEHPIVQKGFLEIEWEEGVTKTIGITRAHLEEDAGKSLHEGIHGFSGIDLNRAGNPLLEIVSEPDIRSAVEAVAYLKTLHTLIRYLDVSDANMQEGSFRCDVNISLRPVGESRFGTRAEIKNINSFRFVERAIHCEIERQSQILEKGERVVQETRLYDPDRDETRSMRSKEEAQDYRYFPDPDLLPLMLDNTFIDEIQSTLPELPQEKKKRFEEKYGLSSYDAKLLTHNIECANYFENILQTDPQIPPKIAANWINGEIAAALNKHNMSLSESPIDAKRLAGLLRRLLDRTLSNNMAKHVFEIMWNESSEADDVIEKQGLKQINDTEILEQVIDDIIAQNPNQVAQYRSGKDKLFAFFVGQVMKATRGKANPEQVNELLRKKLS